MMAGPCKWPGPLVWVFVRELFAPVRQFFWSGPVPDFVIEVHRTHRTARTVRDWMDYRSLIA